MPKLQVEIKKLVLKLGNREIELTFEEAKKLSVALNDLFGDKTVYVYPTPPIYIDSYRPYWVYGGSSGDPVPDNDHQIWCDSAGNKLQMNFIGGSQTLNLSL
jgi:hypothetical protein